MDVGRALAGHLVLLALVGCGPAAGAPRERGARGDVLAAESAPARAGGAAADTGQLLDEASARRLLAARFRAAGMRIVEDVALETGGVTLVADGFDPARRVGYEYIAGEERDVELAGDERALLAAMPDVRILVTDEATAGALEQAAAAFLADLPR
ncbi:MAG TPA: hypothetical protein VFU21_00955 [Kofleriaceae bacterium]|nr:hypothetical protein [Kofleriaceae bacterium]